jgi:hypothetical protein
MPQAIGSEVYVRVHNSRGDIHPRQDLHRTADEVGNHCRQADDVVQNRSFEQVGEMSGSLGGGLRFGFTLINMEIGG